MSDISNTALAFNTSQNMAEQQEIVKFIQAYPSEEGNKALKSYKHFWIYAPIVIVLVISIVFASFIFLDLYAKSKIIPAPSGTITERVGKVWSEETITYTYEKKMYTLQLADYPDLLIDVNEHPFFPQQIATVRIFLDKDGNLIDIYNESEDWSKEYAILVVIDCIFVVASIVMLSKMSRKYWGKYVQWFSYEIYPIMEKKNFDELVKTKHYYEPRMPKLRNVKNRNLVNNFRKSNLLVVLFSLILIALIVLYFVFFMNDTRPSGLTLIDYIVCTAITLIFTPIVLHFDNKASFYKQIIIQKFCIDGDV